MVFDLLRDFGFYPEITDGCERGGASDPALDPSSHPWAGESLNVFEHIGPCCIECRVGRAVYPLVLEQAEEAFASCVITAMAQCVHRTHQLVVLHKALVVAASKLAAAIAMQDHRMAVLTLPYRHLHRPYRICRFFRLYKQGCELRYAA